jgi:hypothetical protein
MANRSFGLNRGQTEFKVTEGTDAPPGAFDVEVCINLASFPTGVPLNNEIHVLLEQIKNWIVGKSSVVQ